MPSKPLKNVKLKTDKSGKVKVEAKPAPTSVSRKIAQSKSKKQTAVPPAKAYAVGQTHERWTPFIVEDREIPDASDDGFGLVKIKSWRPGVRHEQTAPDDVEAIWDGEGTELRRIVAVVTIDGGGVRILYRRSFRRPDGKEFGKPNVRMTTPSGFSAWARGSNMGLWCELQDRRAYIASLNAEPAELVAP